MIFSIIDEVKVTVLEGSNKVLSAFDEKLVKRAVKSITRAGICELLPHRSVPRSRFLGVHIRTDSIVKEVTNHSVILQDGTEIPCGTSSGFHDQRIEY